MLVIDRFESISARRSIRAQRQEMKHHYVPQFLLKAWTRATNDRKVEAFRLDLPNLPSKRLSPRHTAYECDLYALTEPNVVGIEHQEVETGFLQKVDSNAASVMKKMTKTGLRELTPVDRYNWVVLLMSLKARTPEGMDLIGTHGPRHLKASLAANPEEYDALSESSDPATLEEWTERNVPGLVDNFGMLSTDKLMSNPEVVKELLGMQWVLWDFDRQENQLLLADRPCIFTARWDSPNLVVALPVGPTKAFMLTKSKRAADSMRGLYPKELLKKINESSIRQAQRRIYACDQNARRFIQSRLRGHSAELTEAVH